jgi:hypothetical protein
MAMFPWFTLWLLKLRKLPHRLLTLQPKPHLLRLNHRFLVCSVLPQHH